MGAQQLLEVQEHLLERLAEKPMVQLAKRSTKQMVSQMTQLATKVKKSGVKPSRYSKRMAQKLAALVANLETANATKPLKPCAREVITLGKRLAKEATRVLIQKRDHIVEQLAGRLMILDAGDPVKCQLAKVLTEVKNGLTLFEKELKNRN